MIKDKETKKDTTEVIPVGKEVVIPEEVSENPFVNMYEAVRRTLLTLRENPENPVSSDNMEYETAFPAVFIHFTNVRYLVQQQRLGEGRATMRIRFILNNLNNSDDGMECEPFRIFQRINVAIQDAKSYEPALNERCNLLYFDMPTTSNMLQAYWVDYEVWFRESSAWKYRKWVERYVVMPPFTNHDDAPKHDEENHGNHKTPGYGEVSGFTGAGERLENR